MMQKIDYFTLILETSNKERVRFLNELVAFNKKNNLQFKCSDYEFFLVLDEAISNSMEHGNKWNKNKRVEIHCSVYEKYFLIRIKDEGNGFDYSSIHYEPTGQDALRPRGRGIFIMKKFCKVSWDDSGKIICLDLELN